MDAVKFLRERDRMCEVYSRCDDCPIKQEIACCCEYAKDYEFERMVEIVEKWSRENPEVIGKKYIIEIDGVNEVTQGKNGSVTHPKIKNASAERATNTLVC